jgi:glycosyltransferase involved in cell wall biosynthesis
MKILMVNTYDTRGGAARSAFRIYRELKACGVDIGLMVQNKWGTDPGVLGPSGLMGKLSAGLRPYLDFSITFPWHRRRTTFFPAYIPGDFISRLRKYHPDLVHLNWITGGFIRLEDLARIERPLVWTLHDMWAFTGGCHYAETCTRYENGCGACPVLRSASEHDPSRWIFNRKIKTYRKIKDLTIITPSLWLADCVRKSPLLGGFPVEVMPNSLDMAVFYPEEKKQARQHFGLDPGRKIILFGALDATRNKLKGFAQLSEALQGMPGKENTELAVFGSAKKETSTLFGFPVRYFGYIADDANLRMLYSAADVMVVPSIQEVFGQTATEAMACATPVVAFGSTGLADIVEHRFNGYLAHPFDPADLATGIRWCLDDPLRRRDLSLNAVKTVENKFDMKKNVRQIIGIYERACSEG